MMRCVPQFTLKEDLGVLFKIDPQVIIVNLKAFSCSNKNFDDFSTCPPTWQVGLSVASNNVCFSAVNSEKYASTWDSSYQHPRDMLALPMDYFVGIGWHLPYWEPNLRSLKEELLSLHLGPLSGTAVGEITSIPCLCIEWIKILSFKVLSWPPSGKVNAMTLPSKRQRTLADGSGGILNEKILLLVFKSTNWNPFLLCRAACVSKKLAAIAKRLLWKEFCLSRAPKMVSDLISSGKNGSIEGGWDTLARLMFFCGGCQPTANFRIKATLPGHFIMTSRFSKTSGKSFLAPPCRTDTLYVTDLCEHGIGPDEDDVGIFRGIFRGFSNSRTWRCLIQRKVQLEQDKLCPYCRARVWSMTAAKMIPKSASRRLAAYDGNLEYFVCLNGHMHGKCSLLPLSDSEDYSEDDS
eukprot:Gb_11280 [translate_table: standard]